MTDLLTNDAHVLSSMLADGSLSCVELMQATLTRIAEANPKVNAIVSLRDSDQLMALAREADNSPRAGWLHGIPIAIKDLTDAEGLPTSQGSPVFAGQIAQSDDVLVARLRAAGAIVIGKTNTPEFGLGSHTYNPVFGATVNPYAPSRTAGGSSGGAAVALSTGMLSVADGSDMMGSLRNPAGWGNVYGFRPTWSLVPDHPSGESYFGHISTKGPMARSVKDIAALLGTMGGIESGLPYGMTVPDLTELDVDVKGRRIAWLGDWGGAIPMELGTLDAAENALETWRGIGCEVEAIKPPFSIEEMWESWVTLRSWTVGSGIEALYDNPETRDRLKPEAVWEIEQYRKMPASAVQRASAQRSDWFRAAARLFERYDAVILPSAQVWPFPLDWDWPKEIAGRQMDTYHRWMQVMVPVSLIGLPALCVPGGFSAAGLPFGLQVIGPYRGDRGVLELGQAWHRATGWPQKRPPQL